MGIDDFEFRKKGVVEVVRLMVIISEDFILVIFGSDVFFGVYRVIGNDDLFREYKEFFNRFVERVVSDFEKEEIDFRMVLKFVIIGNVIDFVVGYFLEKIEEDVREMFGEEFYIDYLEEFFKVFKSVKIFFYLIDNCGEIYFDRLFLKKFKEVFLCFEIYIVGKEGLIINDVIVEDL